MAHSFFILVDGMFLHSVVSVSCVPSTCVLQMHFLLCFWHVGVALGAYGPRGFGRFYWSTIHLQPPQVTALEAAFIHYSLVV